MEDERDEDAYMSLCILLNIKFKDVKEVRKAIESTGVKIVFQTLSSGKLYIVREYVMEQALKGNLEKLEELKTKKGGKNV